MKECTKNSKICVYTLSDISKWMGKNSEVQLPVIQRGFVWKPNQIEDLWDSIFKGYPIGSLMLSEEKTEDCTPKFMLLDGQQRATSIAIGFNNPWSSEGVNEIGNAKKIPVVWVDIAEQKSEAEQENEAEQKKQVKVKYIFRVVTLSHPWGYQLNENTKPLRLSDRNAAFEQMEKHITNQQYTKLDAKFRFPYDSKLPIPLPFLIEAAKSDSSLDKLENLLNDHGIVNVKTKHNQTNYAELLQKYKETGVIKQAIKDVKDVIFNNTTQVEIPAIILPNSVLQNQTEEKDNEESTLFVRLNRSGTRLDGEELMFSMYKSIYGESQKIVECAPSFIAPSKIISLLARLVLSETQCVKVSFKQFSNYLQKEDFKDKLKNKEDNITNLITKAIDILSYNQVPCIIVKKFIREATDGFLLLLHWLEELNKNKNINEISDDLKQQICGCLYRTYWFGDMEAFVKESWNKVCQLDWKWNGNHKNQYPLVDYKLLYDYLVYNYLYLKLHVPSNAQFNKEFIEKLEKSNQDTINIWNKYGSNKTIQEINDLILNRLLVCRSLILLAQREYIYNRFKDFNQFDNLEDTNTPWDWDHIYPNSWVYRKKHQNHITKLWENKIGNFRAMSLAENRSENNNLSPKQRLEGDKFDENCKNYFICSDDKNPKYLCDWDFWEKLNNDKKIVNNDDSSIINHAMAIITRSVNIYKNFLDMFNISASNLGLE